MYKPMITLIAATALLAGCTASAHPWAPQHQSVLGQAGKPLALAAARPAMSAQALEKDRRPAGPTQSAMDDLTFMKMVDLDRNGQLAFEEFALLGIFPAIGYGIKVQPVQPTLEDIQRKVFHDFDKNDDNKLGTREFKELGATISSFLSYKSLEEVVILIDMNEDGALTVREWKLLGIFGVHRKAADKGPRPLAEWVMDTFDRLDTNNDGQLKEKEQRMVWQTMWYDGKPWLQ
jgi:Ca2+-binding EF-hand superfamily protein